MRSRISIRTGIASRILQMGDVLTLVEKAQSAFDEEEARKLEKKVRKEGLDLQDFLSAMRQMQKLGPLEGVLKMLPGVNAKMLKQANLDPKRLKHLEAIVLSMTPAGAGESGVAQWITARPCSQGCGAAHQRGQSAARAVPRHAADDEESRWWRHARHARAAARYVGNAVKRFPGATRRCRIREEPGCTRRVRRTRDDGG